mgnify:CR=1 FL=1
MGERRQYQARSGLNIVSIMTSKGLTDEAEEYDVVVVGTGLAESMIACSAAQGGKKVLHVDSLYVYGRNEQTQTLDEFIREPPCAVEGNAGDECSATMPRQFDDASRLRRKIETTLSSMDDVPEVKVWRLGAKTHPSFCGHLERGNGDEEVSAETGHPALTGYKPSELDSMGRLLFESRRFNMDLSPKLVLASGDMVDALLRSGTANYLEFKPVDGLFYVSGSEANARVQRVPCSKSDVFADKSFSALEKRKLMKFLQSTMDWGRQDKDGADLNFVNETVLAQGRSLHRPQNKAGKDISSSFDITAASDKPIQTFLEANKLPDKLQQVIVHALCLHSGPLSGEDMPRTLEAMRMLYHHLLALGRFGKTAFIYPLYGAAELPQAFCRMCAVWGGTYMLRTHVQEIVYDDCSGLVCELVIRAKGGGDESEGQAQRVKTKAIVMSTRDWGGDGTLAEFSIATRTSICMGTVFENSERSFAVIPPDTCGNSHCVHVFQMDSSAQVCPDGYSLVYFVTTVRSGMDDAEVAGVLNASSRLLQSTCPFKEVFTSLSRRTHPKAPLPISLPSNVVVIEEQGQEPYIGNALKQAQAACERLFPGLPFLEPPQTHNGAGEDDDEEDFL